MAKSFGVKIKGLEGLKKKMASGDKMAEYIDGEMTDWALSVNEEQVRRTPVDNRTLRLGNQFNVSKPLQKKLWNNVEYAPYQEFGTGGLVDVPAGLEDVAGQYKGAGKRTVNMRAQPFFYTPFFSKQKELVKAVKAAIKKWNAS